MEVIVLGLMVPDLGSTYRQGARALGSLLDGGSHCTVNGVGAGLAGVREILAAAASAEVPSSPIHGAHELSGQDGLRTAGEVLDLDATDDPLEPWGEIDETMALCVILGDRAGQRAPVAILYSRSLPSMGPMPPCELRDLQATWVRLAGGVPAAGRYLLEETSASWDPELEERLTERLRQLYGD